MIEMLNSIADKWFSWELAIAWQIAVLIGIIWVIDLLIRKWAWPQVRYALWLLVLVKLVLPPTLTSPASFTAAIPSLAQKAIKVQINQPETTPEVVQITEPVESVALAATENANPSNDAVIESTAGDITAQPIPANILTSPVESVAPAAESLSWKVYAFFVWLAGVAVLAVWLILRLSGLRREHIKSGSHFQLPERFDEQLAAVAKRLNLKRLPQIILTNKVCCPAVFGVFKPVLLMPAEKLKNLTRQDVEHILLHELAHIKRGDLFIHGIHMMLQIAFWFNPLLWLIRKQLQNLRELCCDATVAKLLKDNTYRYRETLLETARQLLAEPIDPGLGLLGLFENSNWLVERLKWLEKKTWKNRPLRIATICVLVGVMLSCVLPMAKAKAKQTSQATSKKVVLPYSVWMADIASDDQMKVLGFASGEIVELSGFESEGEFFRKANSMAGGDVYVSYKQKLNKPMITFFKSAGLGGERPSDEYQCVSPIPIEIPWVTTVRTKQGHKYQFSLVSFDENECVIEYKALNRAAKKAMAKGERQASPVPKDGLYENSKNIADADSNFKVEVGPNEFKVGAVVHWSDNGSYSMTNAGNKALINYPLPLNNPDYQQQSRWADVTQVHLLPQADKFDLLELRVFDHYTRELLVFDDSYKAVGCQYQPLNGSVEIYSVGKNLPEQIDVWMRVVHRNFPEDCAKLKPENNAQVVLGKGTAKIKDIAKGKYNWSNGKRTKHHAEYDNTDTSIFLECKILKQKYQICAVGKDKRRYCTDGAPHFLMRNNSHVIDFPVAMDNIDYFEISKYKGRDTLYFDGIKLPQKRNSFVSTPAIIFEVNSEEGVYYNDAGIFTSELHFMPGKKFSGVSTTNWRTRFKFRDADSGFTSVGFKIDGMANITEPVIACYDDKGMIIVGPMTGQASTNNTFGTTVKFPAKKIKTVSVYFDADDVKQDLKKSNETDILNSPDLLSKKEMTEFNFFNAVRGGDLTKVKQFISQGFDINATDGSWNKTTALHMAGPYGKTDIAKFLIEAGADIDLENRSGQTPLICASSYSHQAEPTAKLLIKNGANVTAIDNKGMTPLHHAGTRSMSEMLLGKGAEIHARDNRGWTPLHYDCNWGRLSAVEYLLEQGADIEARDIQGRTPVMLASANGRSALVEYLLSHKANISALDDQGRTLLHWAVIKNEDEIRKLLNGQTADGGKSQSAVDKHYSKMADTVRLLTARGADLNAKDTKGLTALDYAKAAQNEKAVEILSAENGTENSQLNAIVEAAFSPPDDFSRDFGSEFTRILPNGVTVELLGICEHPSKGKQWWSLDGSSFTLPDGLVIKESSRINTNDKAYEFLFKYQFEGQMSSSYRVDGSSGTATMLTTFPDGGTGGYIAEMVHFNNPLDSTTVRVSTATGPWLKKNVYDWQTKRMSYVPDGGTLMSCFKRSVEEQGNKISLTVEYSTQYVGHRVVAVLKDGTIKMPLTYNRNEESSFSNFAKAWFDKSILSRVKQFEFQIQPVETVTFKNVALRPSGKTEVEVETQASVSSHQDSDIPVNIKAEKQPMDRTFYFKLPLAQPRFHWKFTNKELYLSGRLVLRIIRDDQINEIVVFDKGKIAEGWEAMCSDRGPQDNAIYFGFQSTAKYSTIASDKVELELIAQEDLDGVGRLQTGVLKAGTHDAEGKLKIYPNSKEARAYIEWPDKWLLDITSEKGWMTSKMDFFINDDGAMRPLTKAEKIRICDGAKTKRFFGNSDISLMEIIAGKNDNENHFRNIRIRKSVTKTRIDMTDFADNKREQVQSKTTLVPERDFSSHKILRFEHSQKKVFIENEELNSDHNIFKFGRMDSEIATKIRILCDSYGNEDQSGQFKAAADFSDAEDVDQFQLINLEDKSIICSFELNKNDWALCRKIQWYNKGSNTLSKFVEYTNFSRPVEFKSLPNPGDSGYLLPYKTFRQYFDNDGNKEKTETLEIYDAAMASSRKKNDYDLIRENYETDFDIEIPDDYTVIDKVKLKDKDEGVADTAFKPDIELEYLSWQVESGDNADERVFWLPSGEIAADIKSDSLPVTSFGGVSGHTGKTLCMWFKGTQAEQPDAHISIYNKDGELLHGIAGSQGKDGWIKSANCLMKERQWPEQVDIKISYALGTWEDVIQFDTKNGAIKEFPIMEGIKWQYEISNGNLETALSYELVPDNDTIQYRHVLVGHEDVVHDYNYSGIARGGVRIAHVYKDLKSSDLGIVKIQRRQRVAKTFKNISLRPGGKTEVLVESAKVNDPKYVSRVNITRAASNKIADAFKQGPFIFEKKIVFQVKNYKDGVVHCIDFDTERIIPVPSDLDIENKQAVHLWAETEGVDAIIQPSRLTTVNMASFPVEDRYWTKFDQHIFSKIKYTELSGGKDLDSGGNASVYHAFKSSSGRIGVAGLLFQNGTGGSPHILSIQYKLLKADMPLTEGEFRLTKGYITTKSSIILSSYERHLNLSVFGNKKISLICGDDITSIVAGSDPKSTDKHGIAKIILSAKLDKTESPKFTWLSRIEPSGGGKAGDSTTGTGNNYSDKNLNDLFSMKFESGTYPLGKNIKLGTVEGRDLILRIDKWEQQAKSEVQGEEEIGRIVDVPKFPRIPLETGGYSGYGYFTTRKWDERVAQLLSGKWEDIKPVGVDGKIIVLVGHALSFNIHSANNTDLASLDKFAPDDLQSLTIPHSNMIDSRAMPHVGRLTGLERLILPGAKIWDEDIRHIAGLTNLKALSLQSCPLTDDSIDHLSKMKSLKELNLWETAITQKGYKKLKKRLPQCKIQWEERLRKEHSDLLQMDRFVGVWQSTKFSGLCARYFKSEKFVFNSDATFEEITQFTKGGSTSLAGSFKTDKEKIVFVSGGRYEPEVPYKFKDGQLIISRRANVGRVDVTLEKMELDMLPEVGQKEAFNLKILPDENFQPYNKFPVGMALFKAKELFEKDGFKVTEEPKNGNGWLSGSKYIGPENTHHIIRAEFKSGQLIHVLEMAIDP